MADVGVGGSGGAGGKQQKKKKGGGSGGGGGKGGGGFQSLGLSEPVYRGIVKMGFRIPTPVQRKSLPVVLSGADTVVMARTGSGKTAAFLIPVLERLLSSGRGDRTNDVRGGGGRSSSSRHNNSAGAVVLSPTRELSLQTLNVCRTLATHTDLRCIGINGGESMEKQFELLSSSPDIVVATPGRLAHHLTEIPDFHLRQCETVVFDEADRLFEMGFAMQIRQICSSMPRPDSGRQTLLFSATMPKVLVEFTKSGIMGEPAVVRLDSEVSVSDELRIGFLTVRSGEKDAALLHLLRDVLPLASATPTAERRKRKPSKKKKEEKRTKVTEQEADEEEPAKLGLTLIFAATRHHVDYLTTLLNHANLGLGRSTSTTTATTATGIYGTMDQTARRENLSRFRSGQTPILVVTDVAARGLDVPLIDHVVHYAFPPSAKLFVHRSGRAARAGRVGYCWGLVDPEEMPYMVDLHVFLGRRLSSAGAGGDGDGRASARLDGGKTGKEEGDNADESPLPPPPGEESVLPYGISEMMPDMVHFGSVPESTLVAEVENVRRLTGSELTGSHDAEALRALIKVCGNAMKQYRRSRPEASRAGVRRAKSILEGEKGEGGRRSGGMVSPHPLLKFVERERLLRESEGEGEGGGGERGPKAEKDLIAKMENLRKREDFLRTMSNFRPRETIFETFATGRDKDAGVVSQVDKGRTTSSGKKKADSNAALGAMKCMRRQMKLARHKGSTLVVAGSRNALALNGEEGEEEGGADGGTSLEDISESGDGVKKERGGFGKDAVTFAAAPSPAPIPESKRRMSKAERKRLKKGPNAVSPKASITKKAKEKRGEDFRDNAHYIDYDVTTNKDEAERSRQMEAAMQPSAANAKGLGATALRLEESMLDIVGDENDDLVKRQRLMRWDKSKRKYVQTSVGSELSGDSKSKKIRLESGQLVKGDKMKLGELYEKWQKKTNKSVGRVGVFDDVTTDGVDEGDGVRGKISRKYDNDDGGKGKTASQIRKEREKEKNLRIKNMKKEDRGRLERRERSAKMAREQEAVAKKEKAFNGKRGPSGRWASNVSKKKRR